MQWLIHPSYYNLVIRQDKKNVADLADAIPTLFLAEDYVGQTGDFNLTEGLGYAYVLPLPAGEYTLDIVSYGNGVFSYAIDEPLGIPISVASGQMTCLGAVVFQHHFRKAPLGNLAPTFAALSTSDECERDVELIRERFPSLRDLTYEVNILPLNQ